MKESERASEFIRDFWQKNKISSKIWEMVCCLFRIKKRIGNNIFCFYHHRHRPSLLFSLFLFGQRLYSFVKNFELSPNPHWHSRKREREIFGSRNVDAKNLTGQLCDPRTVPVWQGVVWVAQFTCFERTESKGLEILIIKLFQRRISLCLCVSSSPRVLARWTTTLRWVQSVQD